MARRRASAPHGFFTLADVAGLTDIDADRISYWCSRWGAILLEPTVNPAVHGGTRLFSECDLVKIALIPTLIDAGLDHTEIRRLFTQPQPGWWDLSRAQKQNKNFLDWLVLIRDGRGRTQWYLVASVYEGGPAGRVASGPIKALTKGINDAIWRTGPIRGWQVIELSNVKRELLERITQTGRSFHDK